MLKISSGDRFGFLTVIDEADRHRRKDGTSLRMMNVVCDCGTKKTVRLSSLTEKTTISCGCFHKRNSKEVLLNNVKTHGKSGTRIYWVWSAMIGRCHNPKNKSYPRYGGLGITVCDAWRESFEKFSQDMGERPEGLTLERIDPRGNYEPQNTKWASYKEQARNRRNTIMVKVNGKKLTLAEACELLNIDYEQTRVGLKENKQFNGLENA